MKLKKKTLIGMSLLAGVGAYSESNNFVSSAEFPEAVLREQLNIKVDPKSCETAYESIAILKKAFSDNVLRTLYFPGDNLAGELVQFRKKIMGKLPECFSGGVSWTINEPYEFDYYTATNGPYDRKGEEIEASQFTQKLHIPLNAEFWKSAWRNY